jgi:L-2-hydroxyglutarate oxidase LhgO|tara:strand:- start:230 stop:376 length:147 start_codon:yes stop_codon:yes gene_type:complete
LKKITKIAIIGGGFYGPYLAYKLSSLIKFKIKLFEKNNKILVETAIKN